MSWPSKGSDVQLAVAHNFAKYAQGVSACYHTPNERRSQQTSTCAPTAPTGKSQVAQNNRPLHTKVAPMFTSHWLSMY